VAESMKNACKKVRHMPGFYEHICQSMIHQANAYVECH
jgi:hypothetical protein